jgi:hypothetical protein
MLIRHAEFASVDITANITSGKSMGGEAIKTKHCNGE